LWPAAARSGAPNLSNPGFVKINSRVGNGAAKALALWGVIFWVLNISSSEIAASEPAGDKSDGVFGLNGHREYYTLW